MIDQQPGTYRTASTVDLFATKYTILRTIQRLAHYNTGECCISLAYNFHTRLGIERLQI